MLPWQAEGAMELFFKYSKTMGLAFDFKSSSSFSDTTQYLRMESTDSNIIANGFASRPLIL